MPGTLYLRDASNATGLPGSGAGNGAALTAANVPAVQVTLGSGSTANFYRDPVNKNWYRFVNAASQQALFRLNGDSSKVQSYRMRFNIGASNGVNTNRVLLSPLATSTGTFRVNINGSTRQLNFSMGVSPYTAYGTTTISGGLTIGTDYDLVVDVTIGVSTNDGVWSMKVCQAGTDTAIAGGTISGTTANMGTAAITRWDWGNDVSTPVIDSRITDVQWQSDRTSSLPPIGSTFTTSLADNSTLTDQTSVDVGISLADAATGADALNAIRAADSPLADPLTATDALSVDRSVFLADASAGTDLPTAVQNRTAALSDGAAGTDLLTTAQGRAEAIADQATITDGLSTTPVLDRSLSDPVVGTDALSATWSRSEVLSDSSALADASDTAAGLNRTLSDAATGTDAITIATAAGVIASLSDVASGSDAITTAAARALADQSAITDAISVDRSTSLDDAASGGDSFASPLALNRQVTDGLAISDAVIGGRETGIGISDPLTISDQITSGYGRVQPVADALPATDALTTAQAYRQVVTDPLVVLDQIEAAWTRAAVLTDSVRATDSLGKARGIFVNDALTLTDDMIIFAGRVRDLNLTMALLPSRYGADLGGDRYALDVDRGRYEARVP